MRLLAAFSLAGLALVGPPTAASSVGSATIVQLTSPAACTEAAALAAAGSTSVDAALRLWRVPAKATSSVMPRLRARGAVAAEQRERTYRVAATTETPDPRQAEQWWLGQVGLEGLTPPGPGVPITIVDSGLDITHPEFANWPTLSLLNAQEPVGIGGVHGTMVASVIGAPVNGVGIVGIYPSAAVRSWDAAQGPGTNLDGPQIAGGILAAARAGKGVINLSVGGTRDLAIELAVEEAVGRGSLVVAAAGNDGQRGNTLGYPASLPHVTTVAATNSSRQVATFSSHSPYIDIAAPGQDIIVATPLGQTWETNDGTSFAAPLVAGAAAWIWTVRPELTAGQLAEILRRSARDIDAPGRDPASGFGMLNVGAALGMAAPARDPFEPNDDIDEVDPNGDRYVSGAPSLTTPSRRSTRLVGRVDTFEDPRDVYRVWLPANRTVVATLRSSTDGDLALFGTSAPTVTGRFARTGRLATATTRGTVERLRFRNAGRGRYAYAVVRPAPGTSDASYRLELTSAAR